MAEMNIKYVFHIPRYKFENNGLILIEIDDILDNLISGFKSQGIDSFYMSKVKSFYKNRLYDELLITVFTSDDSLEIIFKNWFLKNNDVLCQEAFAYEKGNRLIIEEF